MRIGFGILLNYDAHNFIRKAQLDLHQQFGFRLARQPPHITIKSPFDTDNVDAFSNYFQALSDQIQTFDITFQGFGDFNRRVIFLDVLENQKLLDLHHEILLDLKSKFGIIADQYEGQNVKFHASIAGFETEADFQIALDYLNPRKPSFTFPLAAIGLFYYLGPGNGWIINRKYEI